MLLLLPADFFQNQLFRKIFQEHYQSVKQFGSRSGLTVCRSLSGSKLFAKAIRRSKQRINGKKNENISNLLVHWGHNFFQNFIPFCESVVDPDQLAVFNPYNKPLLVMKLHL